MLESFFSEIDGIRRREGLGRKEMSVKLGISQATYSRLLRGKQEVSVSTLYRILSQMPETVNLFAALFFPQGFHVCRDPRIDDESEQAA